MHRRRTLQPQLASRMRHLEAFAAISSWGNVTAEMSADSHMKALRQVMTRQCRGPKVFAAIFWPASVSVESNATSSTQVSRHRMLTREILKVVVKVFVGISLRANANAGKSAGSHTAQPATSSPGQLPTQSQLGQHRHSGALWRLCGHHRLRLRCAVTSLQASARWGMHADSRMEKPCFMHRRLSTPLHRPSLV